MLFALIVFGYPLGHLYSVWEKKSMKKVAVGLRGVQGEEEEDYEFVQGEELQGEQSSDFDDVPSDLVEDEESYEEIEVVKERNL